MRSRTDAWWASSSGTGDLALTIKGLLVALIPVAIGVAKHYEIELTESDLLEGVQAVTAVISAIVVFVGLLRKIVNR